MKRFAIIVGIFYILLAIGSIYPNDYIGHNAFLATDFLHNFIHLIIGFVLVGIVIWNHYLLPGVVRIIGTILLALAVLGGWFTGFDIGRILGIITANGVGHIIHLVTGIVCVVVGTNELRVGIKDEIIHH